MPQLLGHTVNHGIAAYAEKLGIVIIDLSLMHTLM